MEKTKENHQRPLARNEDLVVQEMPDEVLVYDLRRHKAHCLNRTAAFVWNHCDGMTAAGEIAALMQREWQTPVSEDVVWFTLSKLSKAELLEEPITLPPAHAGMSRRSAVRRLGTLLAIPAVMTIVAPTAMAGSSIPPVCQACRKKSDGACPTECGPINGTCYSNSGCGNGQAIQCMTCQACFSATGGPFDGTISWRAPGTLC